MEDLVVKYKEAVNLLAVIDPKETPYESKYRARQLLKEILQNLPVHSDSELTKATNGALYTCIGIIDVDVEEISEGESNLKKALEEFECLHDKKYFIISKMKALNQLGILWCLRDDHIKAKTFLEQSLDMYKVYMTNDKCPDSQLYDLADLLADETKEDKHLDVSFEAKETTFETLVTHAYYYLAQVYEKLGEPGKSAECCHVTLSKQLELKAFQPLDWATNAAMLSQHYLAKEDYTSTKRHLIAASVMLDRYQSELGSKEVNELEDDRQEMLSRCKADVGRAWGKYALILLQRSMDKDLERLENENRLTEVTDEDLRTSGKELDFPSIETDPVLNEIPDKYATNFEEARAIFLPAQRFLNEAKADYYKFEEHCVDYVEIQRDLSHMHKVLVYFEPDLSRKFKMHKRRVDLLEVIAKELNVKLFTLLVRQLLYELAETYSAMMDLKLEMYNSGATDKKKINALVDSSIQYFKAYLDTLNTESGSLPEKYGNENLRPALIAYFHLARLHDKYIITEESLWDLKLKNKMQTYCCYKHVVDYCNKNPEAANAMRAELPLCTEMVALLPMKIQRMQQERRC